MVVVVAASGDVVGIYCIRCCCCVLQRHWKETNQVPGTTEISNHPYHQHQLTSSSSSRSLLLVVVGVAVVGVAAADCGGGDDGHLYLAVVLVVVEFYLVRTWYQVKGFCADAHRLTMKGIS